MKKSSYLNRVALVFLAMILTACGSSGNGTSSGPQLGITSLGSGDTLLTKASFGSNLIGKAVDFFSVNEAIAIVPCEDPTDNKFVKIADGTGTIWITRAYAILDEFEFKNVNSASHDSVDDNVQWAIDLLNNDENVDSNVTLAIPANITSVNGIKFKIQRLEDDGLGISASSNGVSTLKGVKNQITFLADIGYSKGTSKVRPSVFFSGDVKVGTTCRTFRFVTDARFRTTVPMTTGTFDPSSVKGILKLDIKNAFDSLTGVSISDLDAEINNSPNTKDPFPAGDNYLDGRVKDKNNPGSTNAVKWANALMASWEVFTKDLSSADNSIDGTDGSTVTHISGGTGIEDNPSCSDVDDPASTVCT